MHDEAGKINVLSEPPLMPQLLHIARVLYPHARAADIGIGQDQIVHVGKVRRLRHSMLYCIVINLDSQSEVQLLLG